MKKLNDIITQGWFMYFFLIQYNYYNIILDNSRAPKSAEGFFFYSITDSTCLSNYAEGRKSIMY